MPDAIRHINLSHVVLPIDNPVSDAKVLTGKQKPLSEMVMLFVEVLTEDGFRGMGFSYSKRAGGPAQFRHLKEIAEVAKKYKLIILSDEIYSRLTFDSQYKSISNFYPEGTIVSTGLSKWCGAGGWRLGFFAIPKQLEELKNSLKILCSESFTSVSAPIQYAAVEAYKGDHSAYLNAVRKILSFTGNYVYENLKSNVINIAKPEGGFYLFPEFTNAKFSSSQEMCKDILNKTGVALLPGSDFGVDSKKMLARLSYTDFDGSSLLSNTIGSKKLDHATIKKYAPNIVEGVAKLKDWSKSL